VKRRPVVLQAALIAVCAIVLAVTANSASATTADLTARVLTINFGADSDKHVTIRRDYGDLIVVSGVAPGVPGEMIFPAPDVDTIRVIAADPAGSGNDIYVNGTTTALTVGQSIDNQTGFELALSGSITTTAGGITSVGPVSITGDTTLTTAGDSVFESTVSGTGTGGKSLTIAGSTGSVTFKGNVTNLASYTSAIPTVFGGTGAVSMTSIGSQTFTGGITNAAGHAATTLTASSISSAGTITSAAASTLTLTATNDITIAGQITGAIRIVKAGSNTLTIARANTTTGGFGINAGTVVVSHGSALGTGPITAAPDTTLTLSGGINLTGPTGLTLTGSDTASTTLRSISGANTLTVPITSTDPSTLLLAGTSNITLAGQLAGKVRISKPTTGTLTLSQASTSNGGLALTAGTVVVSNGSALGTGPITAAPDTTLTLSGGIDLTGPTGLTLTGSATASTILNSTGGANTLTVPITSSDPSTLLLAGTSDITLAGQLSGKVRISKPTTGTLTLSQSSTSNGGLALSAGTVVVSHGSALGTGPISMLPDTTLTLSGGIELTGPSGLTVSGSTGVTPVIRSIGGTNRLSVPITLSSATGIDLGKAGDTSPLELNGALTGSGVATTGQYVTLKGDATVSILQPISAVKSFIASAPTSLSANVNAETETFTGTVSLGADVTLTTAKLDGAGNIINGTLATKTLTIDCRNYIIFSTFTPPYTGLIGGPSGGTAAQKDINLVLTGNSRLMLGGGNTYTGTTTISGSEVTAYAATSLSTGAVTVNGTGTLSLRSNIGLTGVPSISLSGPGRGNGRGALHAVFFMGAPGDVVVTQTITLAGDATISGSFDANLIINGGITGASHVLSTTGWTKLHSPVTGLSGLTNTADAYETWLDRSITTTGAMSFTRTVYLENSLTLTATGLTGTAEFLNATGSSKTLTISTSGDSEFQGQFATPSATDAKRTLNLVKSGAGRLTLAVSSSAPIGTATISNGSLLVSGSLVPTAGLTVSPGTTLFGSGGNLGGIVLGTNGLSPPSTGTLDLGRNATPQRINATGFTGTSTGALLLELDGPDVTYSQLTVSGTVDLADTMLYATVGATPQPGDRYTIIDNTGVGAINGTFLGVAEGDRVVLDTHQFIVSYTGGDGNDVTLTYFGAAPTITASAPATGLPAGGTEVTITGTGFGPGAIVTIGGVPCTGVAVASAHTSLTCTTGAHAAGATTIAVTNIDGQTGTLVSGFTYADPPPAPTPTPTPTPTATPTTAPVIATPSLNSSTGVVTVVVNATGPGTATQRVVASGRLRAATGCTAKKTVKVAGRVTLSCKLPTAVRNAMKRAAVKLTITTTWAPKSGKRTVTVATVTAKRG
jgi:autotransporter-associated beta strand protein